MDVDMDQHEANAELVAERARHGDVAERPRRVDHVVVARRKHVDEVVSALEARGFTVEGVRRGLLRASVAFHRVDAVTLEAADAFTREVVEAVEPLSGDYDGWAAFVLPADAPTGTS